MAFSAPAAKLHKMAQLFEKRVFSARRSPRGSDESGQALVESALVTPLMVFLILGVIQLAMIQHAKIMSEYAAFNAARAGIVWNADPFIMESAATISLLPVQGNLLQEGDLLNPMALLQRIIQRAVIFQANRRMSQMIGWMNSGPLGVVTSPFTGGLGGGGGPFSGIGDLFNQIGTSAGSTAQIIAENAVTSAVSGALGEQDDRPVRITVVNPNFGVIGHLTQGLMRGQFGGFDRTANIAMNNVGALALQDTLMSTVQVGAPDQSVLLGHSPINFMIGQLLTGHFGPGVRELRFDEFNPSGTLLTIRLRYMYLMRIPFANWVIHGAWLASISFQRLYGAIWNPQLIAGETGLRGLARYRGEGAQIVPFTYGFEQRDVDVSNKLAQAGEYAIPIYASHSMRMQSDVYRTNLLMAQ